MIVSTLVLYLQFFGTRFANLGAGSGASSRSERGKMEILIVDDEPTIIKTLITQLNRSGYDLEIKGDTHQCINRVTYVSNLIHVYSFS